MSRAGEMSPYDGQYFRHHSVRAQFVQACILHSRPSELHQNFAQSWREKQPPDRAEKSKKRKQRIVLGDSKWAWERLSPAREGSPFSKIAVYCFAHFQNIIFSKSLMQGTGSVNWTFVATFLKCLGWSVGKGKTHTHTQMENTVVNWHVLFKNCLSAVVKLTLSAWQQIITFCMFCCTLEAEIARSTWC